MKGKLFVSSSIDNFSIYFFLQNYYNPKTESSLQLHYCVFFIILDRYNLRTHLYQFFIRLNDPPICLHYFHYLTIINLLLNSQIFFSLILNIILPFLLALSIALCLLSLFIFQNLYIIVSISFFHHNMCLFTIQIDLLILDILIPLAYLIPTKIDVEINCIF